MTFSKQKIADFKSKGRSYITWRKHLKRDLIKEYFYNEEKHTLKELFPDKNIEYCYCSMYDLVIGDYKISLKYVNEQGTYYMFLAANSYWAPPQDVAIGKAMDGTIYLIRESFPRTGYSLNCREIPEKYINKNEQGFRPKSYNHTVHIRPTQLEHSVEEIADEDVKCLRIAYEGIKAFSQLIKEIS